MESMYRGKQPRSARAPRKGDAGRVCAHEDCNTKLSVYNRREYCHVHAPTKFPRVRGRIVPEAG